ncbi:MAG: hypothetical protein H6741_10365 [Alphaproteobacteria bacterium]|nr:hypothetical protein [Alphaproteobacteria bacterium]
MRLLALLSLSVAAAWAGAMRDLTVTPLEAVFEDHPDYVAHEWGTFTAVAGEDGVALEWNPLNGPSDLPDFVYTQGEADGVRRGASTKGGGRVRMETPVIYFYAEEALLVEVSVDFTDGEITEWYPRAEQIDSGVRWGRVGVFPTLTPELEDDGSDSHYYPAREVDAAPVRVCSEQGNEWERFLFYRGVGQGEISVRASLEGRQVRVQGPGLERVIVFERQGDAVGFSVMEGAGSLERPALTQRVTDMQDTLRGLLIADGLYPKEAEAMLATWEDDWFEEGLRIITLLPDDQVEAMLPMQLSPAPTERVRTLVARVELITPEREARVRRLLRDHPEPQDALAALRESEGRFAEPTLRRLQKTTLGEERARVDAVLAAL